MGTTKQPRKRGNNTQKTKSSGQKRTAASHHQAHTSSPGGSTKYSVGVVALTVSSCTLFLVVAALGLLLGGNVDNDQPTTDELRAACAPGEQQPEWVSSGGVGIATQRWAAHGRSCVTLHTGWGGWESRGVLRPEPGVGTHVRGASTDQRGPTVAIDGDDDQTVDFSILWNALPRTVIRQLLYRARATEYETIEDTIDRAPTFERYVYRKQHVEDKEVRVQSVWCPYACALLDIIYLFMCLTMFCVRSSAAA